jgi:hypothetical protein
MRGTLRKELEDTMSIEEELEQYRRLGVAEEDLSVQDVDGAPTVALTAHGVRTMMESAAAAGNTMAARGLEWIRAEEAHRIEEGTEPAQAEREAVVDAMEAVGGASLQEVR